MPKHGTSDRQEVSKRYYEKNKDSIKAKSSAARADGSAYKSKQNNRQTKVAKAAKIKEATGCADCPRSLPYYALDFDHVRGEKRASVSKLIADGYAWEIVLEEIEKCEVVCATCHRLRTHQRQSTTLANLSEI